jgi:pimeloyl-ACP methyl ester carboxylesterase
MWSLRAPEMRLTRTSRRGGVISFDLPYHGRSMPPDGWWEKEYLLTTGAYAGIVMAFVRALGLQRPVMLGCSMGGFHTRGHPVAGRVFRPVASTAGLLHLSDGCVGFRKRAVMIVQVARWRLPLSRT